MLGTTQSKVGTRINSSVISTLYLFSFFFKHEASFKQYLEIRNTFTVHILPPKQRNEQ